MTIRRRRMKSLTKGARKPSRQTKGQSRKQTKIAPKAPGKRARERLPADPGDPREKALELMKKGLSQSEAARSFGLSVQKLARHRKRNTKSKWKGRKWVIRDTRPVSMLIASKGKIFPVPVPYRSKSIVGRYWNALNKFLETNRVSHLKPFEGTGIRDADRKFHPWETAPNILRKLDGIGELSFVEIYADTVT